MLTIGEYVEYTQPEVFMRLSKFVKPVKKERKVWITVKEAEELMRHDTYRRIGGAIRQVGKRI
ncbi:hypothetical protein JCM15765_03760 [Paradesulfitobacterium aromaticivorans]